MDKGGEQVLPVRSSHPTNLHPATLAIHADDGINVNTDVAPPLHVSTTFRYSHNPDELVPIADEEVREPPHILKRILNTPYFGFISIDSPLLTFS